LHEIARRRDGRDPAIAEFTARTEVVADSDLDQFYPRLWPAQVTVRLADRSIIHRLVTAAEGDPGRSLDEAAVLAKFRRLTTPSLPLETADRLAASSLAATHDGDAMATLLRDFRNLSQY
jgi:2-methylcitrate dehydratase PrpD